MRKSTPLLLTLALALLLFLPAAALGEVPPPVINTPIYRGDTQISGTCIPGATVSVEIDSVTAGSVTDTSDGTWSILVDPLNVGDSITAKQVSEGVDSDVVTSLVQDVNPAIDFAIAGETAITGTGIPGASIAISIDNTDQGTISVGPEGTWCLDHLTPLIAGQRITATQTYNGHEAGAGFVVVDLRPTIHTPMENQTTLSGTGYSGATITATINGGESLTTTAAGAQWTINTPTLIAGQTISVIQTYQGKTSTPVTSKVYRNIAPGKPTNLQAIPGHGEATLTWEAPQDNGSPPLLGYALYLNGSQFDNIDSDSESTYTFLGLQNGTPYVLGVSAVCSGTPGGFVESQIATVENVIPTPFPAPQNLAIEVTGPGTATFTWEAPENAGAGTSITGYEVRKDGEPWIPVAADTSPLAYEFTGLISGTYYTFSVQAVNDLGVYSEIASAPRLRFPSAPGTPYIITAFPLDKAVLIRYDAQSGITGYKFSTDEKTWETQDDPGDFGSYTFDNLTNGTEYTFHVVACNPVGESQPAIFTATPNILPSAPTNVDVTYGDESLLVTWSPPDGAIVGDNAGDYSVDGYEVHVTDGNAYDHLFPVEAPTIQKEITGLTNGTEYTITVRAYNSRGDGPASDPVTQTPRGPIGAPEDLAAAATSLTEATLTWQAPTALNGHTLAKYILSYDGKDVDLLANQLTHPVTGLTAGEAYTFSLVAVSDDASESNPAMTTLKMPTLPGEPTNLSANPDDGQISLSWTAPENTGGEGYSLTGYEYSVNGGEWTPTGSTGTSLTLSGTNGTTYNIRLRAVNAFGHGEFVSFEPVIPNAIPLEPRDPAATPGNGSIRLAWLAPYGVSTSSYTVDGYKVTITDNQNYTETFDNITDTGYLIENLKNGTTYTLSVLAYNSRGDGPESSTVTAIPNTVPGAPTITEATPGNHSVDLTWEAPTGEGVPTEYFVTTNLDGDWLSAGTNLTYTHADLFNGESYTFYVKAFNVYGEDISAPYGPVIPNIAPDAPEIIDHAYGDGSIDLTWTAPTGDYSVDGYTISISGGGNPNTIKVPGGDTTTATIPNLTNGTTYTLCIQAYNNIGHGIASNTVTGKPLGVLGAPENLRAEATSLTQVELTWTPAALNGHTFHSYHVAYGVGSGADFNASPGTISGLTAGEPYTFDVTTVADSFDGPQSEAATVSIKMPTLPGAPIPVSATAGDGEIVLLWTAPTNTGGDGYPLTGYEYSIDSGSTWTPTGSTETTYPVPATNGTPYTIQLRAVNAFGESNPASFEAVTPYGPLGNVTNFTGEVTGPRQIRLTWNAPTPDELNGHIIHQYELSGGPEGVQNIGDGILSLDIDTGLEDATEYNFTLVTVAVDRAKSSGVSCSVTTWDVPQTPQNPRVEAGDGQLKLLWDAPDNGGTGITGYTVTLTPDGGSPTNYPATGTEYLATGLTNGQQYSLQVYATNAVGNSQPTAPLYGTPSKLAAAPTGLAATATGDGQVTLAWNDPTDTGGLPIDAYNIAITGGGATDVRTVQTNPATLTGLTNGTEYTFSVAVVNANGEGAYSASITATPATVPAAPQSVTATPGDGQITLTWQAPADNGGSAVTGYKVRLDDGAWEDGSNFTHTFRDLTNGQTYTVAVLATNAIGEGAYESRTATPASAATTPAAPQSVTATPGDRQITLAWQAPADNGGSPVLGYRVRLDNGTWNDVGDDLAHTFNDLTNGQAYTVSVLAYNAVGDGPAETRTATPSGGDDPDPIPPAAPTLNTPAAGNDALTGTGIPGATVHATINGTGNFSATVTPQGSWIIAVPPLKGGDIIAVTQTVGTLTSPAATATVPEPVPNLPLNILPIYEGENVLRGTSNQEGATVEVYEKTVSAATPRHTLGAGAAGSLLGTATVTNGQWAVPLPRAYKADDSFTILLLVNNVTVATDSAVVQPIPGPAPTEAAPTKADPIYPYGNGTINGSSVNGREAPSMDAKVLRKFQSGTPIEIVEWGMTGADGSGPWCKIIYNDTIYFVHSNFVNGQPR